MKNTTTAIVAAAALVVGLGSGAAAVYGQVPTRTPFACHEMAGLAMDAFQMESELVSAVQRRGDALNTADFREADAEVNDVLDDLAAIAPKYDAAEDDCLGLP